MASLSMDLPAIAGESAVDRFRRLSEQWKEESMFISSITKMAMLPSYQSIIGMGWPAVPLMLEDLLKEPQHWFWALNAITGANPVPPEDAGDMVRMAEHWINWGRENHIIES
jgi:hypothetical protein